MVRNVRRTRYNNADPYTWTPQQMFGKPTLFVVQVYIFIFIHSPPPSRRLRIVDRFVFMHAHRPRHRFKDEKTSIMSAKFDRTAIQKRQYRHVFRSNQRYEFVRSKNDRGNTHVPMTLLQRDRWPINGMQARKKRTNS